MDDLTPLMIAPRARDIGGLAVHRLLPSSRRRMVGPFIFLDHIGPARLAPGEGVDVPPHPHIGLATVTYLFDGALVHRDSLGSVQAIRPGDVNWMSAGRGIVHSERSGPEERAAGHAMHGIQAWVALPGDAEDGPPTFHHHPAATLPSREDDGVRVTLIAGTAHGMTAPVTTASPLYYLDIRLAAGARVDLPREHVEHAVFLVDGAVTLDGMAVAPRHMAVAGAGEPVVAASADSHLLALGGAAVGRRLIWWNFVASGQPRIDAAKAAWRDGGMPTIPGETGFIPLPEG